jgi:hypothetical protein
MFKSLRSETDNIFLVLTVLEKDLQKEKNYNHFFKPLVDDLKRLESGVQTDDRTVKMGRYATVLIILRHQWWEVSASAVLLLM